METEEADTATIEEDEKESKFYWFLNFTILQKTMHLILIECILYVGSWVKVPPCNNICCMKQIKTTQYKELLTNL